MIGERLKALRKANKLTQEKIAEELSIQLRTYRSYEQETRSVPVEVLELLADFYHVSSDYLLGRTNNPVPYTTLAEMHIVPDADRVAIKKGPPGQEAGEPVKVVERVIPAGAKMPATPEELAEFVRAVMAEGSEDQRTT